MFNKYKYLLKTSNNLKLLSYRNCNKKCENVLNLKEKHSLKNITGNINRERKLTFGGVFLLIIPAFTFYLGCWQVKRWFWKENLINELKNKIGKECCEFPIDDLDKLNDMEYRKVEIEGEFLHEREFLIYPRGRLDKEFQKSSTNKSGLVASNNISSSGAHIITPFKIKGTNLIIMVNRGWIPKDRMAKEKRLDTFPTGNIKISGIVRKSENRPQFVSRNQPNKGIWFYKNFQEMGDYCGSEPIYIEATEEHTYLPYGPISGQSNVDIRNKHVEYFVTWYSLTALTLLMWYIRLFK